MSLVLQEANYRMQHTNTILGTVSSALTQHSRSRSQMYSSQESLANTAGAATQHKMLSPTADILTRLGIDHMIIGVLAIILQIILDILDCYFSVYSSDTVSSHLAQSNAGLLAGLYYIIVGVIAVRIGSFSRNLTVDEIRRSFRTFHWINGVNFLLSLVFLAASLLLLYNLLMRLQESKAFDWTIFSDLYHSFYYQNDNMTTTTASPVVATTTSTEIHDVTPQPPNAYEIKAAVACALVVNGFHAFIAALEFLLTFTGCLLRPL